MHGSDIRQCHLNKMSCKVDVSKMPIPYGLEWFEHRKEIISVLDVLFGDLDSNTSNTTDWHILLHLFMTSGT